MRTTLKRRIGLWEQVTGKGRAASPLSARNTISHYQQPTARGRFLRGIGRFLLNTALVLAVVAGGAAGGLYLWANEKISQTAAHTKGTKQSQQWLQVAVPDQPVIALVAGYDQRRGLVGDPGRTDTVMLVRLDPRKGRQSISLLSFPRDLRVPLYCKPGVPFATDKINSAYANCGLTGVLLTVQALTGLPVNYDVAVKFRGFKDIVNKMGGVWVDVDHRYYVAPGAGYSSIDLQPGYQRLRGEQALDYARYRHGDSDLYRIIRQQAFIRSFRQQFSKLSMFDYPSIINTISRNIDTGNKGGGSISARTLLGYAQLIHDLSGGSVVQVKLDNITNAPDGTTDLIASQSSIDSAVEQFTNPDLTANDRAASQIRIKVAHAKSQADAAPAPEKTTVLVLNASDTGGLATDTSAGLSQRGYKVVQPAGGVAANYAGPGTPFWHSIVYYDPAQAKSEAAATKLVTFLDAASVKKFVPSIASLANGAMVVAALGQAFDGTLPPIAPKIELPASQPPRVTINPGLTASTLRGIQPRFRFRLELPSRVASSSVLGYQSPVRVYRIAPKQTALCLTLDLPNSLDGYWSIEETTFTDAPILAESHVTQRIGGRTFDFYYQDGLLHMVVLRENGASYWVINTLDNLLSNSTMKAIAEGLHPAGGRIRR
jgi:LCP family protein required for cell wall assembly